MSNPLGFDPAVNEINRIRGLFPHVTVEAAAIIMQTRVLERIAVALERIDSLEHVRVGELSRTVITGVSGGDPVGMAQAVANQRAETGRGETGTIIPKFTAPQGQGKRK
jgi:hypothetical protein